MDLFKELDLGNGLVISNDRCLFDRTTGTLALADLHLGLEGAAMKDGVYFPWVQMDRIVAALRTVLDRYSPRTVVINGDLKHSFDRNLGQERKEVKVVLGVIADKVDEVILVRGNHDNFIIGILPPGTELPLEAKVGRLRFVHGHKPMELGDRSDRSDRSILVLGHEHPSVLLRDKVGASVRLPCFLHHPEDRILILPAFSTLTKGSDVLSSGFLSKVLKDHEPGEFMAYGVSEIGLLKLGRLGDVVHVHDTPDDLIGPR